MDKAQLQTEFDRLRCGDREAFARIYAELKKPVYTVAMRIVQSVQAAEDVTQDVFLKLFTSPPEASVKNCRAWVFAVTRNLCLDRLKKKREEELSSAEVPDPDGIDAVISRLDVEAALSKLGCLQREIVSLRLTGGLGFGEIAQIVSLPLYTVYRTYRKAISALRQELYGGM